MSRAISPLHIFVSHADRRREVSVTLQEALRKVGLNAFVADHTEMSPEETYAERFSREIRAAPLFLALVDRAFLASKWCRWELATARQHRRTIHWIDLNSAYRESALTSEPLPHNPWYAHGDSAWSDPDIALRAIRDGLAELANIRSLDSLTDAELTDMRVVEIARKLRRMFRRPPDERDEDPPPPTVAELLGMHGHVALVIDARPDAASQLAREMYGLSVPPPWWLVIGDLDAGARQLEALADALDADSRGGPTRALVFVHRMLPARPGDVPEDWVRATAHASFYAQLVRLAALARKREIVEISLLTSHPIADGDAGEFADGHGIPWQQTFASPGYTLLKTLWKQRSRLLFRAPGASELPALAVHAARLVVVGPNPDGVELPGAHDSLGPLPGVSAYEAWDAAIYGHQDGKGDLHPDHRKALAADVGVSPLVALIARLGEPTVVLTSAIGGAFERLMPASAVLRIPAGADPAPLLDRAFRALTRHRNLPLEVLVLGTPWHDERVKKFLLDLIDRLRSDREDRLDVVVLASVDDLPALYPRQTERCADPVDALHDMLVERALNARPTLPSAGTV